MRSNMRDGRKGRKALKWIGEYTILDSGEEIRNDAADEVVQQQHYEVISPPSSTNSVISNRSRCHEFDSDDSDRKLLDEHINRMSSMSRKD